MIFCRDLNELDELKVNYEDLKNDQQYVNQTFNELNAVDVKSPNSLN